MPELTIEIGGRPFTVACQDGEEPYLEAAARMLDTEATVVLGQVGRMPELRMLLMAGLMLADKTTGLEDDMRRMESEMQALRQANQQAEQRLAALSGGPLPAARGSSMPEGFEARFASLVEDAEALARRAAS